MNNASLDKTASQASAWSLRRVFFWSTLIFAAIVRLKDLSTGLPLHTLYGENETVDILIRILQNGDLNPHHYDLPALAYYVYLPFVYSFYLIGKWFGYFQGLANVPVASFIFVGRFVCALFGTATVYWTYKIGRTFGNRVGLFAMAVIAATPQHIEFSHMVRPEIPAIFFVLLAMEKALSILQAPTQRSYCWFGILAGICFSIKYTIGLPLVFVLLIAHWTRRKQTPLFWPLQTGLLALLVFVVTNLFLFRGGEVFSYWLTRVNTMYFPGEDYYERNIFFYYLDYLTRYNYNLPLILFSTLGLLLLLLTQPLLGLTISIYPIAIFLWLCSFETRRVHGLLPVHPFLALWAAYAFDRIAIGIQNFVRGSIRRLTLTALSCLLLFWPYYRTSVQAYLFSQTDNRSKAELWMTNHLPLGSKIALLQDQQMELDPEYFNIENFDPTDYVFGKKDFFWFRQHGFDYIAVSSGQYVRYFTEGEKASKYRSYFLKLFDEGSREGTLVLDLVTHPYLIPDFRIKIFSTRKYPAQPEFLQALENFFGEASYALKKSGTIVSLPPGYYSLELPQNGPGPGKVKVQNLKLNETILQKKGLENLSAAEEDTRYPFAIFPVKQNSRFSLFQQTQPELVSSQLVQFSWRHDNVSLQIRRIPPAIEVAGVKFSPLPTSDPQTPFLLFEKNQNFQMNCALQNATSHRVTGYVEGFLSEIGEPQPWKDFEASSGFQEFFLDAGQSITIEIPMNTRTLSGDHQLSFWIFTRQDLPFSPQNGGWFNKEIRVNDPLLGIHPVYKMPIP